MEKKELKKFIYIIVVVFVSCSDRKSDIGGISSLVADSASIYLQLANSDSIPLTNRYDYNRRAFNILIERSNDSLTRVDFFKVANRYYNLNKFLDYKEVSLVALEKSREGNDTISAAKAYLYLGDYYKDTSLRDSALYYYVKAEKIYSILRENENLAAIKIRQAEVLWNENDYFTSETSALDALKYLRNTNDKQKNYEALVLLGIISNALKNYNTALEYLQKALELAESNKLQSISPLETTLNNIGNVYQGAGNNKLAIKNFERALQSKNLYTENPLLLSVLLDNLAYSKYKLGERGNDVETLFEKSITIKDSLRYYSGMSFSETRLGEYYYSIGKVEKAVEITTKALEDANKSGNVINRLTPLKQLSSFEIQNSRKYSDEYIKLNDSVQQAERKIKDKFARIQFETEEISLQKDKLAEQNRNLLLFFVGTVMIGLLLFVIRTQRAKNRELMLKQAQQKANEDIYNLMLAQQNNIEEGRIKEKKRIAQELHDGVLSRLFGARLNLDSLNKMDGGEAMEKRNNYLTELKNIEQDIREISHDLNREKFVLINNFLAILNNLLEEQAANFEAEVETNIDENIPWERVNNTLKINIYRITQEALQNINKYANATKIKVSLSAVGANLILQVSDNGQGFAVDKKSKGIGLQNMLSRAAECDGQLDIKSKKGKGTTISISFPTQTKVDPEQVPTTAEPVIA